MFLAECAENGNAFPKRGNVVKRINIANVAHIPPCSVHNVDETSQSTMHEDSVPNYGVKYAELHIAARRSIQISSTAVFQGPRSGLIRCALWAHTTCLRFV